MGQSIGLVMIVKNEAQVIGRLAESVREFIDYWVICDTGSTDGTPAVVRHSFAGLPGELHHDAWVDYSTNRNLALQAARGKADYLLLLDADQTVRFEADLPELTSDAYLLLIDEGWAHWLPRLVRGDLHWYYVGSVHEYLALGRDYRAERLPQLVVRHFADGGGRSDKFQRERALLERDLADDPDNPRTLFYLAQTAAALGQGEEAAEIYRRRIELGGWAEEVFWSRYQRALLVAGWDRSAAVAELMQAWEYRPTRAEPLYDLARLSRESNDHHLAHLFASEGRRIPYPDDEILFVVRWVYEWGMDFEWAIAAYWVGDVAAALQVNEQLLARRDLPLIYREATRRNRDICVRRLEDPSYADAGAASSET
ncbi:MAG: glycosyltransferase [Acidimicrobiales bacterium]